MLLCSLQIKFERLLTPLQAVAAAVAASADRVSLAVLQQMAPAAGSIFRSVHNAAAYNSGTSSDLLDEARLRSYSTAHAAQLAALPYMALMSGPAEQRYEHVLARVALLDAWACSEEWAEVVKAGTPLHNVVDLRPASPSLLG